MRDKIILASIVLAGLIVWGVGVKLTDAQAQTRNIRGTHATLPIGAKVTGQTLDASHSFELEDVARGFSVMSLMITVTDANDSVTALTMTCTGSMDNNTTDYTLQSVSVSSGVGTGSNSSWVFDPSGVTSPKRWLWRVDIEGIEDVECTFTDTGGVVADILDVSVYLGAG